MGRGVLDFGLLGAYSLIPDGNTAAFSGESLMSTFAHSAPSEAELELTVRSKADNFFIPKCPLRNGSVLLVDVGTGQPLAAALREKILSNTFRGRKFAALVKVASAEDLEQAAGQWSYAKTQEVDGPNVVVLLLSVPRTRVSVKGRTTAIYVNRIAVSFFGVAQTMLKNSYQELPTQLAEAIQNSTTWYKKRETPALARVPTSMISRWLPRQLFVATPPPVEDPPHPEQNDKLRLATRAVGLAAALRRNRTKADVYHFKRRLKILDFDAAIDKRLALKTTRSEPEGLALQQWSEMVGNALTRFCHWRRRPKWLDKEAGAFAEREKETVAPPAICFSGKVSAVPHNGGESVRTNVIDKLNAQVMMALTYKPTDGCNSVKTCKLEERFPRFAPFTGAKVLPWQTREELLKIMEALPHWPAVLEAYNRGGKVTCVKVPGWTQSDPRAPYTCNGIVDGDTIFAPVLGDPKWNRLRQMKDLRNCLDVILEAEAKRGSLYSRVIHSRIEYEWLKPHPPLKFLYPPSSVWIPSGEDFSLGLNDRHAVLSRAAAEVYLRRWDFIMDGTVMWIDPQMRRGRIDNASMLVPENFLGQSMIYFQQHVQRFPAVQYLSCSNDTSSPAYRIGCQTRKVPTFKFVNTEPGDEATIFESGSRYINGRYASEMEMAIQHSLAMEIPGAQYNMPKKDASCSPTLWHAARMGGGSCVVVEAPLKFSRPMRDFREKLERTSFKEESQFINWLKKI